MARELTLRWLKRLLIGGAALVIVLVIVGIAYEQVSRRALVRTFPPPGRLIEHDGRLSHLHCIGEGAPIVILESGLDTGGSQTWSGVQPGIAAETRVCSYDRAGILWSEPREEPRDAERIAAELGGLLSAAEEAPPYVMVGHSLGGPLVRVFADRFPDDVVGFVFVDSSHPEQRDRYPPEALEVIAAVEQSLPSRRLTKLVVAIGIYRFAATPPEDAVRAYLWRTVPWGFLGERAAGDDIFDQAHETGLLGDRPLIVLSAGAAPALPGLSDEVLDEVGRTWLTLQAELAALSTNSVQRTVESAGHFIHVDAPDAVVSAVLEVVSAARTGAAIGEAGG